MANWPYNGPWARIRLAVLERDGHRCQIVGPSCTGFATHVDHIIPVEAGGDPYDTRGLRAACATCNIGRGRPSRYNRPLRKW